MFGELTAKGRALIDEVFPAHVDGFKRSWRVCPCRKNAKQPDYSVALSQHARRTTGERVTEDD